MLIVPQGAPEDCALFVALVVLVGLAVCALMRSRHEAVPPDGLLRERPDLPNPNPVRPGPLRELQRRFRAVEASKLPSDFGQLCESVKDAPRAPSHGVHGERPALQRIISRSPYQ
jgi:hypothetical protein